MIAVGNTATASKTSVAKIGKKNPNGVTLMLGKADMVTIKGEVADVLVANPSIVDVMAVKSNRLYLVGSQLGDTNIIVLDHDGNILKKFNIHVQMDTERLQDMIYDLYPNENVMVRALTDQVVLTGDVSTPAIANKIANLVGHYAGEIQENSDATIDELIVNMLSVRGEQQVMLKVKIVEASRSAVKNLGLNLQSLGGANVGNVTGTLRNTTGLGLTEPEQLGTALLNYGSGTFGDLSFLAQALETEGIINTLAEPNLTAISGEQAGFLAGGEFPIPAGLDQNGNFVFEFKPFGVSLNFRPHVMSKDRISLQLTTEVSTTSFDQNLQLNGVNIPAFNVRRAETNVELPSGGTLMIAGLIESDSISSLTQLPGVGDVPVVGDLIKSDSFQRSESEVLIMITPYLVQPFAQNETETASLSVSPKTAMTVHDAPETSFGAILPEDPIDHPLADIMDIIPARKPGDYESPQIYKSDIFTDNLRRVYGEDAPENLMIDDESGFGYMLN